MNCRRSQKNFNTMTDELKLQMENFEKVTAEKKNCNRIGRFNKNSKFNVAKKFFSR